MTPSLLPSAEASSAVGMTSPTITVAIPTCQHRTSDLTAAIPMDNSYCSCSLAMTTVAMTTVAITTLAP